MQLRWIGALLIVIACGAFGFHMAREYLKEISTLKQLCALISYMENELRYQLSPLPELFRNASSRVEGVVRSAVEALADLLECNSSADASGCMDTVLRSHKEIPENAARVLMELGATLGCFDLDGQLSGLEAVRICCTSTINELEAQKADRTRNYQILGLCAGAALAILLL